MYYPPGREDSRRTVTRALARERKTCHTNSMNKTQTTYRVIAFGHADHGFFNRFDFAYDVKQACKYYDEALHDPKMDGCVIIRVNHETWEVILEFGTEGMSIGCGPHGNFKVTKSPELVML